MKTKLILLVSSVCFFWICYSGFSGNDDSPKWNIDPRTLISLNPEGQYLDLPAGTTDNYSTETRYTSTPQGTFAVGPNFRVHPTSSRTQSETPITRSPLDPNLMFASANTYNVGGTTTFSTSHYVSTNGGVTWFGDDTTNFNFGDPGPMVMYTGRLLISYITSTGAMGAAYSANLGATWSGTVTFPGSTTSSDKNLSCTDGTPTSSFYGRCYTVYTEFSGANVNRIVATWSSDGGVTWSSVIPVSPVPSAGHHHQGCDVTVDIYGWVRVTYANCTTNGQNSTEDYLGWAESGTGGVSWGDMSDVKVNTNGIRTSDLLTPSNVAIRANGFPRIATDLTTLPSADDDYVVMAEKNFAPALDNADIVLMRTQDGGASWTRTRVNQNAAGSYEYFPAVNVDETGAVNVVYYSTRNVPTNDSAEVYLSRSTNGGVNFVDVKISDHKFKPIPISGLATGYQGDYIGITSGGAGKIVPYWCEQGPVSGGRYQAWSSLVDVSKTGICEDFAGTDFNPTDNLYEEYTGTNFWSRLTPSAYNTGTGSARFNSWSASAGTTQSLTSYQFTAVPANTYLTFDEAYASWSGGPTNIDSLIVESSINGGTTYTNRARLYGGINGNLNSAPPGGELTPTGGQWRPKIYLLPVGTNKIRLRGVSAFGNDIWVDNVCVQTLSAPVANSIGISPEGMLLPTFPYLRMNDTVRVYKYRSDFPTVKVDSAKGIIDNGGVATLTTFGNALTGNYYTVVKHRNTIETWSNTGLAYTRGGNSHFNFIQPAGQAYANNQKFVYPVQGYYGMFSGDVNQDGFIDLNDITLVFNDASAFVTGYKNTDVTGDNITDLSDLIITFNNSSAFVEVIRPPGAEPAPSILTDPVEHFVDDAVRQKDSWTKNFLEERKNQKQEITVPNWNPKPPEGNKGKLIQKPEVNHQYNPNDNAGNP